MIVILWRSSAKLCRVLVVFACGCLLLSCEERDGLAPVVERNWQPFNKYSKTYKVRRGDTLYAIAFRYELDYQDIAHINHLRRPYALRSGQELRLRRTGRVTKKNPTKTKTAVRAKSRTLPIQWTWPAKGTVVHSFDVKKGQKGIDIQSTKGSKVRASAGGTVAYAGNGLPGYKNLILIRHPNHLLSAYAYNGRLHVREGAKIVSGQVIADMGKIDGARWGVHFEIRKYGKPINPLSYLKNS